MTKTLKRLAAVAATTFSFASPALASPYECVASSAVSGGGSNSTNYTLTFVEPIAPGAFVLSFDATLPDGQGRYLISESMGNQGGISPGANTISVSMAHINTISSATITISDTIPGGAAPTATGFSMTSTTQCAPNTPPTANAGADQTVTAGLVGDPSRPTFILDGSNSSDVDGDRLTYSWVQTSGPNAAFVSFGSNSSASPTMFVPSLSLGDPAETLVFELTVSDGTVTDTDTVSITVNSVANTPPTVTATDQTGTEGTFIGGVTVATFSDPDTSQQFALTVSMTGLPPGLSKFSNPSSAGVSGTPTTAGTYTVTVTVSDGVTTTSDTFDWVIAAAPVTPTVAATTALASIETSGTSRLDVILASGYVLKQGPSRNDLTVSVNGNSVALQAVAGTAPGNNAFGIILQNNLQSSDTVTVAYSGNSFEVTETSSSTDYEVTSFTNFSVVNNVTGGGGSSIPPLPFNLFVSSALVSADGTKIDVILAMPAGAPAHLAAALHASSTPEAIGVNVNGTVASGTTSTWTAGSSTFTLNLAAGTVIASGDTVTLEDPTGGALALQFDPASLVQVTDVFSGFAVTNNSTVGGSGSSGGSSGATPPTNPAALANVSYDPANPPAAVNITPTLGDVVTITNGGSAAETFSIVEGGVTQGTPLTLQAGATGDLTFAAAPTASGAIETSSGTQLAVFTVTPSVPPTNPAALANVSYDPANPPAAVSITPTLGDVVTITNGGSAAETFSIVEGGVTQGTPLTLQAGATGDLTFAAAPTASGAIETSSGTQLAVFTVTPSVPPTNPAALANVSYDPANPPVAVNITPTLGDVVTITNGGSAAETFSIVEGGVTQGTPLTLQAGATGDLTFAAAPTASGAIETSSGTQLAVFTVTPSVPPTNPAALAAAATSTITSNVMSQTTATLAGNSRMMTMALGRFMADRRSGVVTQNSQAILSGLRLEGFSLVANDDGINSSGRLSFMDTSNGWRRVGYADVTAFDEQGVGHSISINGRFSWERSLNDAALYGYFIGAELQQSKIEGSLSGDQDGFGLLAGGYTIREFESGVIAAGYGAVGFNRRSLNLEDSTSTITDDYNTKTFMLGASFSGDLDMGSYRLRPSLSANYAMTHIGDLSLTQTTSGTTSALAISPGTVSYFDLIATPEFVFDVTPVLTGQASSEVTLAPRLTCEQRKSDVTNRSCGGGVAIGMSSVSRDGATMLNAEFSLDKIGGVIRRGLQLQVQMSF